MVFLKGPRKVSVYAPGVQGRARMQSDEIDGGGSLHVTVGRRLRFRRDAHLHTYLQHTSI
jgi:hypothetical protein